MAPFRHAKGELARRDRPEPFRRVLAVGRGVAKVVEQVDRGEETQQNARKAATVWRMMSVWLSTPAAAGAITISPFFTHWRGRIADTSAFKGGAVRQFGMCHSYRRYTGLVSLNFPAVARPNLVPFTPHL